MTKTLRAALPAAILLTLVSSGAAARAAEEPELGWADTAELSYVVTGGNSETNTLGFKNTLVRRWERAVLTVNAGAIRAESRILTRTAVDGDPNDPNNFIETDEQGEDQLTAESYFLNSRFDRKISDRFFWDAGAGWERNRFAGIENRSMLFGGLGNLWIEGPRARWATTYDVTYTDQEDVVENPDFDGTYAGFRLSSKYELKVGESSKYDNVLVMDGNADESEDLRADWINSMTASINSNLALKVSLQILYDNRPSLVSIDVVDTSGAPTGATVLVELEQVDTIFTASLVVNF